jgi:hypothetical protein
VRKKSAALLQVIQHLLLKNTYDPTFKQLRNYQHHRSDCGLVSQVTFFDLWIIRREDGLTPITDQRGLTPNDVICVQNWKRTGGTPVASALHHLK